MTLLICHAGALGDFILTWPALCGLKHHLTNIKLLAVGRMQFLNLAAKYGLLDRSFDLESRAMMDFFQGIKMPEILGRPAGAVLWLKNADKAAELLTPICSLPIIRINPFPHVGMHLADYYCSVLQQYFSIPYPENIIDILPDLVRYRREAQYVLIHPGSGSKLKNFSIGFYLQLKLHLQSHGYKKIRFILGPAESIALDNYFTATEISRPRDVLELSEWLEKAMLFVGNDSGLSHLAGFLGVPSVVFYRSTDPAIWGVRGKRVWYIQTQEEEKAGQLFKDLLDTSGFIE